MQFKITENQNKTLIFLLVIWPFIFLSPYVFKYIDIGNDFELLYFSYKKYIFEFIIQGHFPKWSPSESLGYPIIFNPFAQYFYFPSWLLFLFSYILGSFTKYTYLIYTIFGLSIYNVGQFVWLRSLNINIRYAFYTTIITCIGIKLTEIIRFPNAVHTIAWFPWVLYSITILSLSTKKYLGVLILFFSTLLIFTAGYPYYILYGFIFFSIYFFLILYLKYYSDYFSENILLINKYKFFSLVLVTVIMSFLIVSPWFLKIIEIMNITRDRNLFSIEFSYILGSNYIDQISSWIFPPYVFAESNYYFGSIISILLLTFLIRNIFSKKIKYYKFFSLFFIFFVFLTFQFSAPENSLIFNFIWEKFDFIKNFRAFCRMHIILIPIIALILAMSFEYYENALKSNGNLKNEIFIIFFIVTISITTQIYLIEFSNFNNHYWQNWQFRRLEYAQEKLSFLSIIFNSYNNYIYTIFFVLSLIVLLFIFIRKRIDLFMPAILSLVFFELFILSNIQWAIPINFYNNLEYNKLSKLPIEDLANAFESKNIATVVKGNTYFRNSRSFNINYFDQFGIDKHTKLYDKYFDRNGKYQNNLSEEDIKKINYFFGLDDNKKKIFLSSSEKYNEINDFVDDVVKFEKENDIKIFFDKDKYLGDEIYINVEINNDGYLSVIDNWAPGWYATNNDEPSKIYRLLDIYKTVKINKGYNKIKMKYHPWKRN